MAIALVPMLVYDWLIYRDVGALSKFDLPVGCILSGYDHQPWWMIPPGLISIGGILLYCVCVWIFYDRNNDSGIVNLVRKNINSDEMIEFKI